MTKSSLLDVAGILTGLTAAAAVVGVAVLAFRGTSLPLGNIAFALGTAVFLSVATSLLLEERWEGAAMALLYFGGHAVAALVRHDGIGSRALVTLGSAAVSALALREALAIKRANAAAALPRQPAQHVVADVHDVWTRTDR